MFGIPFSKTCNQIIDEINSSEVEYGDGTTPPARRRAPYLHREANWLESIAKAVLIFEPRDDHLFNDITVLSSVLEMLGKVLSGNEHSEPLIRPEQLAWHEMPRILETFDDEREEIESFILLDLMRYNQIADRETGRRGRGTSSSKVESSIKDMFESLPAKNIEGIIDNLGVGISEASAPRKKQSIEGVLASRRLYDPMLYEVIEEMKSNENSHVDEIPIDDDPSRPGPPYPDLFGRFDKWTVGQRAVRSEFFIELQGLKRYLSKNGIVSLLYGDPGETRVTRNRRTMARSVLKEHKGVLDALFGDLEEYYTPYH